MSCQSSSKVKGAAASAAKGETYYTQFALFHEGHVHRTTNYRRGMLVPVNTEVVFLKATRNQLVVQWPTGERLVLANVADYSGESIDGIFLRTLGRIPVDLSQFTEQERKAIASGRAELGMSKEAVVAAMGYPPKHKTPSLAADQWRYWQSRFDTILVLFEGDRVSAIQD